MISLKRFSRYTKQQYKTLLSQASKRNYYKNSTNNKKYFSFTSAGLVAIAGITAYTFKREEKTLPIIQCEESYKFPTERLKKPKSGRGIILVECGSFNPPTYLHLRLFEDARDYLEKEEKIEVLGGFMSPVHPEYLKHDKTSGEHRLIMAKLAASQSDWISVDDWEIKQPSYRYTKDVLHHFKEEITKFYGKDADNIRVALLCGADLLKSFTQPGVWSDEDLEYILSKHGVVCFETGGFDIKDTIFESDLLQKYVHNIFVVKARIHNDVTSTKIRRFVKRGYSIHFLVPHPVLQYIDDHKLYSNSDQ